ncbi:hypothetical protein ABV409_07970 [Flagellimonas sp. DF-77]
MAETEQEYKGFWKKLGCILSALVMLCLLTIVCLGIYFFVSGL